MIKIKEPRYRDRKVLVARYRIGCGEGLTIEIQQGSYKGIYKVSNEDICASDIESMKTRNGATISMRAIPLDKLERISDGQ
jgi:hypothetical protein